SLQRVEYVHLVYTCGADSSALLVYARTKLVHDLGPTLSPFNAHEILLGLETLDIRLAKMSANTRKIVGFLQNHPGIQRVYHPLASGDPSSAEAQASLHKGAPSILSIDLVDGERSEERRVGKE